MNDSKTQTDLLQEISAKLDRLMGFAAIAGRDQTDQIAILRQFGFEWGEIGRMVGLKADAARKRLESKEKGRRAAATDGKGLGK